MDAVVRKAHRQHPIEDGGSLGVERRYRVLPKSAPSVLDGLPCISEGQGALSHQGVQMALAIKLPAIIPPTSLIVAFDINIPPAVPPMLSSGSLFSQVLWPPEALGTTPCLFDHSLI